MIGKFEIALTNFEGRIVSHLAKLQNPIWPFVFSFLIPSIIYLTWPFWVQFDYLKIAHWDIVKSVEILFIVLVILSPLALFVSQKRKTQMYFGLGVVLWLVHCYFKDRVFTSDVMTWLAAFAMPSLLAFAWCLSLKRRLSAKLSILAILCFALLAALLVGHVSDKTKNTVYIDLFWGAHVEIFVIVVILRFLTKKEMNQTDRDLTITPMNLITGIFWPIDLKDSQGQIKVTGSELWWRGYYSTLTGFLFQLISMVMLAERAVIFSLSNFLGLQWMTICSFLALTAVARITIGVARLFGVDVPDASNFVLFSRSPIDPLRRGYVYAYEFNLRYICLPLVRVFRSIWLAVILTFCFYVFYRFVLQPLLVPMAYNLIFPHLQLYVPTRESGADIARSMLLLCAFFLEPLFVKLRMRLGMRYGDICCILLTYLILSGMRVAEADISYYFRTIGDSM